MLSLEEYISKRKKEDRLNEFDVELKTQNMQIGPYTLTKFYPQIE